MTALKILPVEPGESTAKTALKKVLFAGTRHVLTKRVIRTGESIPFAGPETAADAAMEIYAEKGILILNAASEGANAWSAWEERFA